MSDFSSETLTRGLARIGYSSETRKPVSDFLQTVLFGNAPVMGNELDDGILFEYRKRGISLADEAIRGEDPTLVNFKSSSNLTRLMTNYYHLETRIALTDADARAFGEPVSDGSSTQMRIMKKVAEERDALMDIGRMNREKLCSDALFNGKVVNNDGEQAYPMHSDLLAVSGATLFTKPLETLASARKTAYKHNQAVRFTSLVMNPDDAANFVTAYKDFLDRNTYDSGKVGFRTEANGADLFGVLNTPAGLVAVYAYYGQYTDASGTQTMYVPKGKAILCGDSVGAMGYGRVRAGNSYVVEPERFTVYDYGRGDMKATYIEYQSAPLPIIESIDGYCVLTNIPASA